MSEKRIIYADNAATTPLKKVALDAMMPYLTEQFGNPSGIYSYSKNAKNAIDESRAKIANAINAAEPSEILFTGSGSEGDNWAFKGIADIKKNKGKHIITSAIEHHAIIHTCDWLKTKGYDITYIPVDKYGRVDPKDVEAAIRSDTILISIIMANNEIGTIEPIAEIGIIAKTHKILFHTDAVQAAGHIPIDVQALNVDLLTISGHKFGGPKGIGVLYIKKGIRLTPLIHGGQQERNMRGGTENVAGIVGLAVALEDSVKHMQENTIKIRTISKKVITGLLKIPYTQLTGDPINRLPGTASFTFNFIEGESIMLMLNLNGICASSGSACSSGSLDPSHVLMAIGLPHEIAHGSVRLTFNEQNTEADADYIIEKIPTIIDKLREMSPVWEDHLKESKKKIVMV
ncbi:MAG: cysteine desulfurase NifS [Candidatus Methanomethylophilaceae archaeon]|nr:cysteine desulfurase NifS [Candidatus Methanomethylophilaceae archaeon]